MTHAFAGSLQQTGGIFERCATEEADIDVVSEYADVCEGRILDTCVGASVVHQLHDIIAALTHPIKPLLRNGPQLCRSFFQPDVDGRIVLLRSRESQYVIHIK